MFVSFISVCILLKLLFLEEMAFIPRFFIIFPRLRWLDHFSTKKWTKLKKASIRSASETRKQNATDLWKPKSWKRYAYPMFAVRNLCVTKYTRANTFTFCEPLFSTFCCNKTLFFQGRVMSNLCSCLFACVFVYLSLWKRQNQTASCLHSAVVKCKLSLHAICCIIQVV